MADVKNFPKFLREAREKAGVTQLEVAQKLNYSSAQFVSNWERGLSYPPMKTLSLLAKMYKVDIEQLFESILAITMNAAEQSLRRQYKALKKRA